MLRSRFACVFALLMTGLPALALAGEPNCDTFITTAPYTISAQGHYCLANDLAYGSPTGAAITIDANSVVLDLRGYKIGGQAAGIATTAVGILVAAHNTVMIRNGLIRGFLIGIAFNSDLSETNNQNNLVEEIRLDSNTRAGIWASDIGSNNTVRNCIVGNTGGTTATTQFTAGIFLDSSRSFAFNNTVMGTQAANGGTVIYGIHLGDHGRAVDNQVIGNGDSANATNYCFQFNFITIYRDNIAYGCGTMYGGTGIAVGTTNYP